MTIIHVLLLQKLPSRLGERGVYGVSPSKLLNTEQGEPGENGLYDGAGDMGLYGGEFSLENTLMGDAKGDSGVTFEGESKEASRGLSISPSCGFSISSLSPPNNFLVTDSQSRVGVESITMSTSGLGGCERGFEGNFR